MSRLEDLKRELFFLEMKTHWDSVDAEQAERLRVEIKELEDEGKTI